MPLYMYQAAYTAESLAAQIKDPQDRIEVVRPVLESAGAKIVAAGYSFGDYDVVATFEGPSDATAAAIALAFGAGGAAQVREDHKASQRPGVDRCAAEGPDRHAPVPPGALARIMREHVRTLTPTLSLSEGEGAISMPSPPEGERDRVRGSARRGMRINE